ncbi:HGGxSTG domain-containing protein [Lysobacter humi (ex Lee et al. 2017)]
MKATLDTIVLEWSRHRDAADEVAPGRATISGNVSSRKGVSHNFGAKDDIGRYNGAPTTEPIRKRCGAKRRRDGRRCAAHPEPGRRRCRWHGGCSTGPQTPEGRAIALANLKQNRRKDTAPPTEPPAN